MAIKEDRHWYALTVFKNMPQLIDAFAKKGWDTFRAYTIEEKIVGTQIVRKQKPLIGRLLFVNCPMDELVHYKYQNNDWFMYYRAPEGSDPGAVKDSEMKAFMLVTSIQDGNLRVLGEDRPEYHQGDKVRVIAGVYKGAEGYIKRIRRSRDLLVCVEGVTVVAISKVPPEYLEKI
jgi:transcription antitermination factor NusG